MPICYARSYRRLRYVIDARDKTSGVHECSTVLVPHGAVYRSVTLAVSAARGSVRYARVKDARDGVPGSLECSILVLPPGARFPV